MMAARLVGDRGVEVDGIDSAWLDCVNDNIGVMLRFHGAHDVRGLLGFQWSFGFEVRDARPLPALAWAPTEQVIAEQAGLWLEPLEPGDPIAACIDALERDAPVLVVADAHAMPWLPYFGRQHMDHSFVVDGFDPECRTVHVADAYQNVTVWGEAAPTRRWMPEEDVRTILDGSTARGRARLSIMRRVGPQRAMDVRSVVTDNARRMRAALGETRDILRFRNYYAARAHDLDSVRTFSLACWLTARARGLHGLWLHGIGADLLDPSLATAFEAIVTGWTRVRDFAYVMERRVEAQRSPPIAAFELLEAQVQPAELAFARRCQDLGAARLARST